MALPPGGEVFVRRSGRALESLALRALCCLTVAGAEKRDSPPAVDDPSVGVVGGQLLHRDYDVPLL